MHVHQGGIPPLYQIQFSFALYELINNFLFEANYLSKEKFECQLGLEPR